MLSERSLALREVRRLLLTAVTLIQRYSKLMTALPLMSLPSSMAASASPLSIPRVTCSRTLQECHKGQRRCLAFARRGLIAPRRRLLSANRDT